MDACLFSLCDSVGIDPLKTLCVLNMGSHLPLGDRQASLSGVERANIRLGRNSRTLRAKHIRTQHCPVRFCVAYHRLGFTAWKQYTRLDLLATRDIVSRKTVINRFSLALRTCLPFGSYVSTNHACCKKLIYHLRIGNIPNSQYAP